MQALAGDDAQSARVLSVYGNNYVQLEYELGIKILKTLSNYALFNFQLIRAGHKSF